MVLVAVSQDIPRMIQPASAAISQSSRGRALSRVVDHLRLPVAADVAIIADWEVRLLRRPWPIARVRATHLDVGNVLQGDFGRWRRGLLSWTKPGGRRQSPSGTSVSGDVLGLRRTKSLTKRAFKLRYKPAGPRPLSQRRPVQLRNGGALFYPERLCPRHESGSRLSSV